jgi:tRNA (guanine6-N2)-methyltransferase
MKRTLYKRRSSQAKPNKMAKPYIKPKKADTQSLAVEFLPGLESFVTQELHSIGCKNIQQQNAETLRCEYIGDLRRLNALRKAVAVYAVYSFAIPRPKALLGDEHWRRVIEATEQVLAIHPKGTFKSFRISAAGQDSSVFQRLMAMLEKQLSLPFVEDGDLLIIIRPAQGWEVAIRLTPRPLSARSWRFAIWPVDLMLPWLQR